VVAASLSLPLMPVAQAQQQSQQLQSRYQQWRDIYNDNRDHSAYHGYFIDPWNDPRSNEANGG